MKCFCTLLVLLLLPMLSMLAQNEGVEESWRWVHFTKESGLPTDRIISIIETENGTPWVWTPAGLSWFDGYRWQPIDLSGLDFPRRALRINGVVGESLLVNCGGEFRFLDKTGIHDVLFDSAIVGVPISRDSILCLINESIYLFAKGRLELFQPSVHLTQGKTLFLWGSPSGMVWANLLTGLYRWNGKEWHCLLPVGDEPLGKITLAENKRGESLVSIHFPYSHHGLWESTSSSTLRRVGHEKPDNVRSLDVAPKTGDAVVVFHSDDIRIRKNDEWHSTDFRQQGLREIVVVKYRQNGDLWFGTDHGLYLYRQSLSRWTYWKHDPPDLRNSINEILRARDGSFWIATSNGLEVRSADETVKQIPHIGDTPLYVVTGLAEDVHGNIWVSSGSSFTGTFRWDGVRWDHFPLGKYPKGAFIHKIRPDRSGRLWFLPIGHQDTRAGMVPPMIYRLEGSEPVLWEGRVGLHSDRIYSFGESSTGALWFGAMGGLSRWKNGSWRHWNRSNGLRCGRVFTLSIDEHDNVWFGDFAEQAVVGRMDANDSLSYFTSADGLVSDFVWDIRADLMGSVWITTQAGLSSFDGKLWATYGARSGLQQLALWPVLPLEDAVYVGTSGRGVAILRRDESRTPPPVVSIEQPILEGSDAIVRWNAFAYWGELQPPEIATRYRLDGKAWSPWQRRNEVRLTDLRSGEHRLQVQARGISGTFDEHGATVEFETPLPIYLRPIVLIPTGSLAALVCTMLVVLITRKRGHDLALRKSEEKFRTVIETTASAIFMHTGTRIIFVNAAAESLTGFHRNELLGSDFHALIHEDHRTNVLEREQSQAGASNAPDRYECLLVTKEGRERWADVTTGLIQYEGLPVRLTTAVDITERKEAELKMRLLATELSTTEERERRRMASYLHDVIGQTLALCKIKVRRVQKSLGPDVEHAAGLEELRQMIEQSIHSTQSLTFELCPPILYELSFEAAVEWLTERLHQQHGQIITFSDDKQSKPLATELRVILFQAVREACINAIKHSEARTIDVAVTRVNGKIRVTVADDGIGFDPTVKNSVAADGGGFGLFNIRERLMHLGGSVKITSIPQHGTTVVIESVLSQLSQPVSIN